MRRVLFLLQCVCVWCVTGSYAMRDLVSNLPSGQQRPAKNLEEDTVVAVLNTIHEIVTDSSENARSLIMAQAIDKLVAIHRTRYNVAEVLLSFLPFFFFFALYHSDVEFSIFIGEKIDWFSIMLDSWL